MMNAIVLQVLIIFVIALLFYVAKRYFDDRAEARLARADSQDKILVGLIELTTDIANANIFVRERLSVFQKALENSIAQFAEIVVATKKSEIDTQVSAAAKLMRGGRRPAP